MKKVLMTRLSVCSFGVSCNEMIDTPMLHAVEREPTTSNIGVSIISLHDTPRLHTLKRVIRIFFIPRTYNDSNKLTLGYIHQNPTRNTKVALLLSNATVIFKISLQNLQNN